jgi:DNA helicase-2/ATP-dependent DNA helicase PcrA
MEYEAQCQREAVVDFPELLLRSYELLERNEPIRRHYQARFRHILVDEFQDTNRLQYKWLSLLADGGREGGASLFCVGDDDQSIYRFRGAEIGNMRDFERDFRVESVIRLEQNYRSHGNILDAANALIGHNTKRLGKNLWTDRGAGEPIRVYEAFTDSDEARWIVEEIQSLVRDGASRSDIALLYRSNAQSRVLEHQLFSSGVAYRVYGGLRFFERQEVKHALAYLRLIANPDDDTAFTRVVNFPTRGIGARSLEALQDAARTWNTPLYQTVPHLAGKPGAALGQFVALIERLRVETVTCRSTKWSTTSSRCPACGATTSSKEGQERLENLDELINAAANFSAEVGAGQAPGERRPSPAACWPSSWPTPRWRPATTRPTPAPTPSS